MNDIDIREDDIDFDPDYCDGCGHYHSGDCPEGPCSDYRCCH